MAKNLLPALAIIAAALFIYWPALNGTWLWDDNLLIVSNARLNTLAGLGKIWLAAPTTDYWPLTWTLLWIEWHLWGDAPLGYHAISLALHIASAFLIWRILTRLGLRRGWIGGLLFAVHPLAIESVAWISEIKNTLSLLLFLLAFDAWLDADDGRPGAYPRSIALYLLAMLAKTSTVMLPLVLALYCWWKRGCITRAELSRLVPYFGIALILGAVTLHFQNGGMGLPPVEPTGFVARLTVAGIALVFYLSKFVLPTGLITIYPAWPLDPPSLSQVLALPVFVVLFELLYFARRLWTRHVLFGLGFFLVTALPILGLVNMEWLAFSPVADHLIYLPMVGLVGLTAAGLDRLLEKIPGTLRLASVGVLALAFAALAALSHARACVYAKPLDFWTYTLVRNPLAWAASTGVGTALVDLGRAPQAIAPLRWAVQLKPDFTQGHYDLANALLLLGNTSDAIGEYQLALKYNPHDAQAHYNLAIAFMQSGRLPDALAQYEQALQLLPDSPEIRGNYAQALMRSGRSADALAQFQQASQLDPMSALAAYNLGLAMEQTGKPDDALAQYQRALVLDPNFVPAQKALSRLQPRK